MSLGRTRSFFLMIVQPTVLEFLESPGDIRKSYLSAIVLNHLVDYWVLENTESSERYRTSSEINQAREHLSSICPDVDLIRDVADTSKHAELRNDDRAPHSSTQIKVDPSLFNAPFRQGVFAGAQRVFVILPDGTRRNLEQAVRSVFTMWEKKLSA